MLKIVALGTIALTTTMVMGLKAQQLGSISKLLVQSKVATEQEDLSISPNGKCPEGNCPPCTLKCQHSDDENFSAVEAYGTHWDS